MAGQVLNHLTLKIKRGLKANLPPSAKEGELLFTTDEKALYIGQGAGLPVVSVGGGADINDSSTTSTTQTYSAKKINELFISGSSDAKTKIAAAITSKGVTAGSNETFDALSDKIKQITSNPNYSTISKLNITATPENPYIKDITLNYLIDREEVTTTVLEVSDFLPDVTRIISDFNNTDQTNFISNSNIVFDSTAHLAVGAAPQVLIANSDINLSDVSSINSITLSGDCLTVLSFDQGTTWYAYDSINTVWNTVDLTNTSDIEAKAMTISTINSLTNSIISMVKNSNGLRFAYYFVDETKYTDKLSMTVDVVGGYVYVTDPTICVYDLLGDNQTIRYIFYKSGTYTINYMNNDVLPVSYSTISHKTKLNITAPNTQTIPFKNIIDPSNTLITVSEFVGEINDLTQVVCDFNNADGSNFNASDKVLFDGTMHLKNDYSSNIYPYLNDNTYSSANIDFTQFNSVDSIAFAGTTFTYKAAPLAQLVTAKADINLTHVKQMEKITVTGTSTKLLISFDSGVTYYGRQDGSWVTVNMNDMADIVAKALTVVQANALTSGDLEALRNGSEKLRFAYYLNQNTSADVVTNDKLSIVVDIEGYFIFADTTKYTVNQLNKYSVEITFNTSGTYSITWLDK